MTGCIEASGHLDKDGYVKVYDPQTKRQGAAHRIAYRQHYGELPPLLRHTCDNRRCVNPLHLVPGTQAENMQDMVERGRLGKRKGETNGMAYLPDTTVAEIRRLYTGRRGELTALAVRFNTSRTSITNYVKGVYRV